jgi:hypothetical protein
MNTLKQMKLTCTTYKNKTYELKREDGKLFMGNIELKDIKNSYFSPCSLTVGDAHLMIVFNKAPQSDGKTEYIFRRSWLNKPLIKSDDDIAVVNELNKAIMDIGSKGVKVLEEGFEGRVDRNCWRTVHICKVKADTIRDQIQSTRTKYLFGGRNRNTPISRSAGHRRIKKIANKAKLHHVTAHVYRHCFATFSLSAGAPLTAVRDAMNHKSISTTSLYLHSVEKDVSTYI